MFSVPVPLDGLIKMVWGRGHTRQRGKSLKPAGPDGMSPLRALACATAPGASPGLPGAQGLEAQLLSLHRELREERCEGTSSSFGTE